MEEFADQLPLADSVVLELQYHRPARLGLGLNLRCLEAMLYGYLGQRYPVFSLSSKAVQSQFNLPTGREKKKMSTKLARDWLNGEIVHVHVAADSCQNMEARKLVVPQTLSDMFKNSKKQDDLADCLLQALTFFQLIEM